MRFLTSDGQPRHVQCPRYDAARAANLRFDFDDRAGRPIKRLHGVLRSANLNTRILHF
jgi:hypothetical protein